MIMGDVMADAVQQPRTRADYEDFLYREAALLDQWRLEEWFALFAPNATYEVPTFGKGLDARPDSNLFYIADDHARLRHRVDRLLKMTAHAEWPRSAHVRMIGNVRIEGGDESGTQVMCSFVTYRSKNNITDTYIGHAAYTFVDEGEKLLIRAKRIMLGMNSLQPHGKISIIL